MMRTTVLIAMASVVLCACSADTFSGEDAAKTDAAADAGEDHKLGVGGDAGSDAGLFGEGGSGIYKCERDYDAAAPPFDCTQATDSQSNPLPLKFICPLDAGQWPSGTAGVECIKEAFIDSNTTLWCCAN